MNEINAQPIQTQPLDVGDFSGGMSDYYLGGAPNKFRSADNLVLVKYEGRAKLRTRDGSGIYLPDFPRLIDETRISLLKYSKVRYGILSSLDIYAMVALSFRKLQYSLNGAAWTSLAGPTGNSPFLADPDQDRAAIAEWQGHLYITAGLSQPLKLFWDDTLGLLKLVQCGLPQPASSGQTITAGTSKYLYKRVFRYAYQSGGRTYINRGVSLLTVTPPASPPNVNAITFTAIPAYSNGGLYNYDTSSLGFVLEFYRTTDNGQVFFKVGEIINGTTTFVDNLSDAALQLNEALYTEGGIPENQPPPPARIVHIMDSTGFYADVIELDVSGSQLGRIPNRFYQSVPGDPSSVPATFYEDMADKITGFSSFHSIPILMLQRGDVVRLEGGYDELGGGAYGKETLSRTAGCISHQSIVRTDVGIFWAGIDGFYFCDTLQVIKISKGINETYRTFTSDAERQRRVQGKYDAFNRRIHWTVEGPSDGDNARLYVLDLNYGISEQMPFTTLSGGPSFSATSIEFVGPNMVRGDKDGFMLEHKAELRTDIKVDAAADPSTWGSEAILYKYVSCAYDFGSVYARKWVPAMSLVCKNETNLSLQITSLNDDGRREADLKPLRYRGNIVWGDPLVFWGDPDLVWNRSGMINERRRFPAKGLRCQYKQIELSNALVAIVSSEVLGSAVIDQTAKTLTLAADWPLDIVGFFISVELDDYVRDFEISAQAGSLLTVLDPAGQLFDSAASSWVIRGRPKGERLFLIAYSIDYAFFGESQKMFRGSATGEVGAG